MVGEATRNIIWRQGHVLPQNAFQNQFLENLKMPEDIGVLVSHDCDLANAQESYIEIIIGKYVVGDANGNYTYAKNARKLHLEYQCNDKNIIVELLADKSKLPKSALNEFSPDRNYRLEPKNHAILQRWLAARYRRSAFPEEFNRRLKSTGLENRIYKILSPLGFFIPAIFFDLDEGNDIERINENDVYLLRIIILYTTDNNYQEAKNAAIQAKQKIVTAFQETLKRSGENGWRYIELIECVIMSDMALTYKQSRILKEWRLEYASLKTYPNQPIFEQ